MRPGNKLLVYKLLKQEAGLHEALPETYMFSEKIFTGLFNRYQEFFAKPLVSYGGGKGVFKVSKGDNHQIRVQIEAKKYNFTSLAEAYKFVKNELSQFSKKSILQQPVNLAEINGRPMDFRVLVQRKIGFAWMVTGKYAKLAPEGLIITNLTGRGKLLTLKTAFESPSLKKFNVSQLEINMEKISLLTVHQLSHVFTNKTMWGLDIGVDKYGKVWLIEANPLPGNGAFRELEDQSMQYTIEAIVGFNEKKSNFKP